MTIRRFQKLLVRLMASVKGSPSSPELAGYLSTSSQSRILIGLDARLAGLLVPTRVT